MRAEFNTTVFGKLKDSSFDSAIHQIKQSFGLEELYPSLEEKAAMLLYLVVKIMLLWMGISALLRPVFCYFSKEMAFYTTPLAKQLSAMKRLHL